MFMAWKMASVFTVAGELIEPYAVYCFGATREDQIAAISIIERDPLRFSSPEWLDREQVADALQGSFLHADSGSLLRAD